MKITDVIKNAKQALTLKPFNAVVMSSIERNRKSQQLMKFFLVAGACVLALEPSMALAQTGAVTNATNFEDAIQKLITWMTGTIAKSVAILAIVVLGFMAMAGKLQMETAGKVILGIVLIFSAAQIVGLIVT